MCDLCFFALFSISVYTAHSSCRVTTIRQQRDQLVGAVISVYLDVIFVCAGAVCVIGVCVSFILKNQKGFA